ncbi:hypothetical protein [Kibdelosporangium philippinense]|uniref:hypothetical protein n=1 Tax=Kibdelosporangium philippinense TaxID=211113 RepID=UPI00360EF6F4
MSRAASKLGWLAGAACAACCVLPVFLVAVGVLGGAAAASLGRLVFGLAIALAAASALAWWWARRRRTCSGDGCACASHRPSNPAGLSSRS